MKKILLNFLFINLFLFVSCKKEEVSNISEDIYKGDSNNIYHSKYTNVVKIQGKFVEQKDYSSYFTLGGREEGKYSDYDIFDAIRFGSLKRVIEIIEKDNSQIESTLFEEAEYNKYMDDNSYNIVGANPLMLAVYHRDIGIIQYLLDTLDGWEGMYNNINLEDYLSETDEDGWNVFIYACAFGTVDIIKALVSKYPDLVYSKNPYGANGLHIASLHNGDISILKYLIKDLKIDINSTDNDGYGVLYYVDNGDYEDKDEVIEVLKELGAEY